ncbi:MAG: helix-hairpin-helix domain-containing protein [Planctomycetota bacterium]|jgi:hypothetical protein
MESSSLQELEQIPGVGKTIAQDMQNIGINSIDDLRAYRYEAERKVPPLGVLRRGQGGRPKMLGGVVFSTLRTFLADNAGIGLCSRPQ